MHGSAAIDLVRLADERIDAMTMASNNLSDTAAGVLIAREGGAAVVDRHGKPHAADTLDANPDLIGELVDLAQAAIDTG